MTLVQVDKLQVLLPGANPALLALLLGDAQADVLTWTNRRTIPTGLESAVRQLVVLRYNKVGIEGQTSHSEGGVSRSFADLPPDLRQTIGSFRLLKVVGRHAAP